MADSRPSSSSSSENTNGTGKLQIVTASPSVIANRDSANISIQNVASSTNRDKLVPTATSQKKPKVHVVRVHDASGASKLIATATTSSATSSGISTTPSKSSSKHQKTSSQVVPLPPLILMSSSGTGPVKPTTSKAQPSTSTVSSGGAVPTVTGATPILLPSPSFMFPHSFAPGGFVQQQHGQAQTIIVDPSGMPVGIVSPLLAGYSTFANGPFLPLQHPVASSAASCPSRQNTECSSATSAANILPGASLCDFDASTNAFPSAFPPGLSRPNVLLAYRANGSSAGVGVGSHPSGIFSGMNTAAHALNLMNLQNCYNVNSRMPSSTVVVRTPHGQLMGFQLTSPAANAAAGFSTHLGAAANPNIIPAAQPISTASRSSGNSAFRGPGFDPSTSGAEFISNRLLSHGALNEPLILPRPTSSSSPTSTQKQAPSASRSSFSKKSTSLSSLHNAAVAAGISGTGCRQSGSSVLRFAEGTNTANLAHSVHIPSTTDNAADAQSHNDCLQPLSNSQTEYKFMSDSPPSVESPTYKQSECKDLGGIKMDFAEYSPSTSAAANSSSTNVNVLKQDNLSSHHSLVNNSSPPLLGQLESEICSRPQRSSVDNRNGSSSAELNGFFTIHDDSNEGYDLPNTDLDPHTLFMQEVERHSSTRPAILTHFIDGFIIQESTEPFTVSPFPFDDFVTEAMMELAAPPELEAEVLSNCDAREETNPPPLACEYCGKSTAESAYLKHPEFCSKSCARQARKHSTTESLCSNEPLPSTSKQSSSKRQKLDSPLSPTSKSEFSSSTISTSSNTLDTSSSVSSHHEQAEAESPPPMPLDKNPIQWNVDDVYSFLLSLRMGEYARLFRQQEIDGQALLLLREEHLMTSMGIKLGPAIKICNAVKNLKTAR